MGTELFRGIATALITPFREGRVDTAALKRLAAYQADRGIAALVVCGTTGEAPTLGADEKLRCVSAAAEAVGGRIPIIAGTGSNDTAASAHCSAEAVREGADAVLAVAPYYNRPTEEGLIRHFLTIGEAAGKPVILYNVPSRTGCDISLRVFRTLAESGGDFSVKEASGRVELAAALTEATEGRMAVYSGCDELILPMLSVGASGAISVVSNLLPYETQLLFRFWEEGKTGECRRLQQELSPLIRALFLETNPIPVKAAMASLGFCEEELRLPLTPAGRGTREAMLRCLKPLLGEAAQEK